jgi:hypothetical protein
MTQPSQGVGASSTPDRPYASSPALLGHSRAESPALHHKVHVALTLATFVLGGVAFGLGMVVAAHLAAVLLGATGVAIGLWCQLTSESTGQRWFDIVGLGAAAVGMGLGFGHGGFGS